MKLRRQIAYWLAKRLGYSEFPAGHINSQQKVWAKSQAQADKTFWWGHSIHKLLPNWLKRLGGLY